MAVGGDGEGVKGLNQSESNNPLDEQIFKLWSWVGRSRDAWYFFIFYIDIIVLAINCVIPYHYFL